MRDVLNFAVWVASFFSSRISWGGVEYRLSRGGEMVAIPAADLEKVPE
jgi:hypothetical protein